MFMGIVLQAGELNTNRLCRCAGPKPNQPAAQTRPWTAGSPGVRYAPNLDEDHMDSQTGTFDSDKPASPKKSLRGFAAMDPQRQREIASLGGRAAHQSGHAHEFTSEEARAAGKKRHARAQAEAPRA